MSTRNEERAYYGLPEVTNDSAILMVNNSPSKRAYNDCYDAFSYAKEDVEFTRKMLNSVYGLPSPSRAMMGTPYYGQTVPFSIFEANYEKVHIYKTPGFHQGNIHVEQKWNNKEKEMYIKVTGGTWIGDVEHELNVNMFFDITVYDKYEVSIRDGLLHVIFKEILNAPPEIKSIINGKESEDDK
jgi:hypothetical protein